MTNNISIKGFIDKIYDKVFIFLVFSSLISATLFFGNTELCNNFNSKEACIASAGQIGGSDIGDMKCSQKIIQRGDSIDCTAPIIGGTPPYNNNANLSTKLNGSADDSKNEACVAWDSYTPFQTWDMGNGNLPNYEGTYSQFNTHKLNNLSWEINDIGDWDGDGENNILLSTPNDTKQVAIWETYKGEYSIHKGYVQSSGVLFYLDDFEYVGGIGDFSGNGSYQIVTHNTSNGNVKFYYLANDLHSIISNVIINNVPGNDWRLRVTSDLSGDLKTDIMWQYIASNSIIQPFVWFMDGSSISSSAFLTNSPGADPAIWIIRDAKDVNFDGHPDILWQSINPGNNTVIVYWLLNGINYISDTPFFIAEPNWKAQVVGDLIVGNQPDILFYSETIRPTLVCKRINTGLAKAGNNEIYYNGVKKGDIFVKINTDPVTLTVKNNREYGPHSLTRAIRVANNNGQSKDRIIFSLSPGIKFFNTDYTSFNNLFFDPAPIYNYNPLNVYTPIEIDGSTHLVNGEIGIAFDGQNRMPFVLTNSKTNTNIFDGGELPVDNPVTPSSPGYISGWAVNNSDHTKTVDLALYTDPNSTNPIAVTKTGLFSYIPLDDFGVVPYSAFRFDLPSIYCDNVSRTFYVKARTFSDVADPLLFSTVVNRNPSSCPSTTINGNVNPVSSEGLITGSAWHIQNPAKPTEVVMYIDGTAPANKKHGAITGIYNDTLSNTLGVKANMDYLIEIPSSYCDSTNHTAYIYAILENTSTEILLGSQTFNLNNANCQSSHSNILFGVGPSGYPVGYSFDADDLSREVKVELFDVTDESPTVSRSSNGGDNGFNYNLGYDLTRIGLTQDRTFRIKLLNKFIFGSNRSYEIRTSDGTNTGILNNGIYTQTRMLCCNNNETILSASDSKINHISFVRGDILPGGYNLGILNPSFSVGSNFPIANIELSNNNIGLYPYGLTIDSVPKGLYIFTSRYNVQHNHKIHYNLIAGSSEDALEMYHEGSFYNTTGDINSPNSQMSIKYNKFGLSRINTLIGNGNVTLHKFTIDSHFKNKTGSTFEGNEVLGSIFMEGEAAVLSGNYIGVSKNSPYVTKPSLIDLRLNNSLIAPDFNSMPFRDNGIDKIFQDNDLTTQPFYYNHLGLINNDKNILHGLVKITGKENQIYGNYFGKNDTINFESIGYRVQLISGVRLNGVDVITRDNRVAGNQFYGGGVSIDSTPLTNNDSNQVVRNEFENMELVPSNPAYYPGLAINLYNGNNSNNFLDHINKNDMGDTDTGPNNLRNHPVIVGYSIDNGEIKVRLIEHVPNVSVPAGMLKEPIEIYIADPLSTTRYKPGKTYLFTCAESSRTTIISPISPAGNITYSIDGNNDTGHYIECSYPLSQLPSIPTDAELTALGVDAYCTISGGINHSCYPTSSFGVNIINNISIEIQSSGGADSNTQTRGGVYKNNNITYTLTPKNISDVDNTIGTITTEFTLDTSKINFVSANGSGWSCSYSAPIVKCITENSINKNSSGNPITVVTSLI